MEKVLVAYFSASGVTAKVAEKIRRAFGADIYEIRPETAYTSADLDWRDRNSRSSVEMQDTSSRPALKDRDAEVEKYDKLFIGFPIWWYREPSIIDTFLEAYDFNGKTVIPFATSGSSGMGQTAERIRSIIPGADIKDGKRVRADVTEAEIREIFA